MEFGSSSHPDLDFLPPEALPQRASATPNQDALEQADRHRATVEHQLRLAGSLDNYGLPRLVRHEDKTCIRGHLKQGIRNRLMLWFGPATFCLAITLASGLAVGYGALPYLPDRIGWLTAIVWLAETAASTLGRILIVTAIAFTVGRVFRQAKRSLRLFEKIVWIVIGLTGFIIASVACWWAAHWVLVEPSYFMGDQWWDNTFTRIVLPWTGTYLAAMVAFYVGTYRYSVPTLLAQDDREDIRTILRDRAGHLEQAVSALKAMDAFIDTAIQRGATRDAMYTICVQRDRLARRVTAAVKTSCFISQSREKEMFPNTEKHSCTST